jgi:isopentenyldiphosphate isomerase
MEVFQLVDRSGRRTGEASREQCHGNPGLIHLVVHLHVFDPRGRLYLQKRSGSKDTNPGMWDTSVGGHVHPGEEAVAAMRREAREELGVDAAGAEYLYEYLFESALESEYAQCYALDWEGPVTPDPAEIEEAQPFTIAEIDAMVGAGKLTPLFEREWPLLRDVRARMV